MIAGNAGFDQILLSAILHREIAHRIQAKAGQKDDGNFRMACLWNEVHEYLKPGHIGQGQFNKNAIDAFLPREKKSRLSCLGFENYIISW